MHFNEHEDTTGGNDYPTPKAALFDEPNNATVVRLDQGAGTIVFGVAVTAEPPCTTTEVVEDDFVLTRENFTEVRLPNEEGFFLRDGPDLPSGEEPCMKDCKAAVPLRLGRRGCQESRSGQRPDD